MKRIKTALIIITISVFILMPICKVNVIAKTNKETKEKCECNKIMHEYMKNENIVFLGDSITDWYPLDVFFEDVPYVNSGIAGNTTEDILNNLDKRLYIYNPTKVFILIGTNDYKALSTNEEQISSNIREIVQKIKKNRPKCKIYVQSIYPINDSDNSKINKENVSPRKNSKIENTNAMLKKMCEEEKITYIDVYSELIADDGALDLRFTKDGLHLNDLGYYKVSEKLIPYIEE